VTLTLGSTFTGIGGADLGFEWAGVRVAWQCEADPWKQTILRAHWPDVPLYDDITTLHNPEPVDIMIGGFPCQDLSVAGKRKGFDGERSVLAFEFLRLADTLAPRWIVLENVPGLLSSNRGRDFARLADEVVGGGYGLAWRILDARYFNVPQRRRRIFLVARRADADHDPRSASGLALRALYEGGIGDTTPGWPPRPTPSTDAGICAESGGSEPHISPAVTAKWRKGTGGPAGDECQNLVTFRKSKRAQSDQDDETWVEADETNTLNRFDVGDTRATQIIAKSYYVEDCENAALRANGANGAPPRTDKHPLLADDTTVRRLTPLECERLMGLPDHWTAPAGIKAPDTKRYAACGDAIVTWVAYWIAQRIQKIDPTL
jgi:DNA (cytosine-5)-methyltransferase 1